MGLLDNIGKFNVRGSVDTQFRTGLALERIAIASGEKVGGFTSFLTTLETIGFILMILTGLFIISAIVIIYVLIGISRIFEFFWTSKERKEAYEQAKANGDFMTDEELERNKAKFELTEDEEEEIKNFH